MSKCIICGREIYEGSEDKCIFHVKKNDWYTLHDNKKIWDRAKVSLFWEKLRNDENTLIDNTDGSYVYNYMYFVFPEFEYEYRIKRFTNKSTIYHEVLSINDKNRLILKDDINFWKKNQEFGFDKKISFEGAIFLDDAVFSCVGHILPSKLNSGELDFPRLNFNEYVSFYDCKFLGNFYLQNVIFKSQVNFDCCEFQDLIIINSKLKSISFSNIQIQGKMDFRCLVDNDLNFRACSFNTLNIGLGKVSKASGTKFDFSNKSISFSECNFLSNSKIEGEKDSNRFKSLSLANCNIGSTSSFNIRNFELNELKLSNLNNNSFNFLIQSIKVTKKLILNDTSFNKTEFIDFIADSEDLNIEFKDISFYGSKLSNFHCKKLKETESERKYSQQLKKVFDEQKDYITANEYYVREMNAYQLGKEKNVLNWISNKLIFWINKKVSNYSQSWILPIVWMFFLGLYFNLEDKTNFSHFAFIITLISGLFLDYLYERENYNLKIAFFLIVPFSYLIVFFLVSKGFHFTSLTDLLNSVIHIKINLDASLKEKIHTIIFGFLIYHLTITVKRKLRR